MKQSLEWLIEEYGLQLSKTHAKLKGLKMRHADDAQQAESTCLVFEATRGNDRLDGPKGSDMALSISYRSAGTPRQNEIVVDAIDEVFSDDYMRAHIGHTSAEREFAFLMRQDEKESDRDETKSLRKRTRRIPFIAKAL